MEGHGNPDRPRRVLVVDDEPMVREIVGSYLTREGYRVSEAGDGPAALRCLETDPPDLVVLDVMLPGLDGFEILRRVGPDGDVPVIFLTARAEELDRVLGLELGADDYVVKPFSPRELVARVRSILRRVDRGSSARRMEFDGLVIDGATREVLRDGQAVELTPREFDLLAHLASSPRRVFSRQQLLEQVWDSSAEWQDPSTVTVHVRRCRRKIEHDIERPRWIQTVWGVGYRFVP